VAVGWAGPSGEDDGPEADAASDDATEAGEGAEPGVGGPGDNEPEDAVQAGEGDGLGGAPICMGHAIDVARCSGVIDVRRARRRIRRIIK
jgi:hypothetical protein